MKKNLLNVLLVGASVLTLASCGKEEVKMNENYKVAMVTDYGDITDQSFNQTTYESCRDFCEANHVSFKYYKPAANSTSDRVASVELAIDEGYNVIVMPGYAFAETVEAVATTYPDVKFIALDVAKGDLLAAHFSDYNYDPTDAKWASYQLPSNVYCAVYQEELPGYMAGYAAVKEGYRSLGFLGGMAVPAVVRYGYGFVQGADAAAVELGVDITMEYAYTGVFYADPAIKAVTDQWATAGVEVVFCAGGSIYTSACESAKAAGKKIIGVDVDQAATINAAYGAGTCITSAMKGLYPTVQTSLDNLVNHDTFTSQIETLGLVSGTDPSKNYVQLPTASWSMTNFKVADYNTLVSKMFSGAVTVSNNISETPTVAKTSVNYRESSIL